MLLLLDVPDAHFTVDSSAEEVSVVDHLDLVDDRTLAHECLLHDVGGGVDEQHHPVGQRDDDLLLVGEELERQDLATWHFDDQVDPRVLSEGVVEVLEVAYIRIVRVLDHLVELEVRDVVGGCVPEDPALELGAEVQEVDRFIF